jgi:hypothetical protein
VLLAGGAGGFAGLVIADNPAGGPKHTPEMLGQALPMTPSVPASGLMILLDEIPWLCAGTFLLLGSRVKREDSLGAGSARFMQGRSIRLAGRRLRVARSAGWPALLGDG